MKLVKMKEVENHYITSSETSLAFGWLPKIFETKPHFHLTPPRPQGWLFDVQAVRLFWHDFLAVWLYAMLLMCSSETNVGIQLMLRQIFYYETCTEMMFLQGRISLKMDYFPTGISVFADPVTSS